MPLAHALLELREHFLEPVGGRTHVFRQALALLVCHGADGGRDLAQGCVNVVHIVHEADEFSSCWHKKAPALTAYSAVLLLATAAAVSELSILKACRKLVKRAVRTKDQPAT